MADPFDTTTAPITEPPSILIGVFTAWRRDLGYDPVTMTVKYRLTPATGGTVREITGTSSDGEIWTFTIPSATSALWAAGQYRWDMLVTRISDSEFTIVQTGMFDLFLTTDDRRTHAEVMVKKIESLLSGRADSDVESYSIKNRSITKMSVNELRDWREYYLSEISRTGGSTTGADRPSANTIRVRWI
jgi:hypothetical protein